MKALYVIDMNNGFVNEGSMANKEYNKLVPEQLKTIEHVRNDGGVVNFVLEGHKTNSQEFKSYPVHCVLGTSESELIPELDRVKDGSNIYYKNCINGMLNRKLQDDIKALKGLREIIIEGVCADLCVMDFARTLARYLDELDMETKIFVVKSAIDTFDSPDHNRETWLEIARMVMEQAGIEYVDDVNELKEKELIYKL